MLPEPKFHTFETRLVKSPEGYAFYRLSKDPDGVFYFISKHPHSIHATKFEEVKSILEELDNVLELPVLDIASIKTIGE
jgi:hypothetical protein